MQALIPFQKQNGNLRLQADVQRVGSAIKVLFQLADPDKLVEITPPFSASGSTVPRKDKLWLTTCFELFLREPDETAYHEFNFSLQPAWNSYAFDQHREPQPPKICNEYYLESVAWDGSKFQAEISGFKTQITYDIGMTAVLKEKSGLVHYMALAHCGAKPDFHISDSFILKR